MRDRCDCGAVLTSLRTWNAQTPEKRADLKARGVVPHMGKGLCRRCYGRVSYVKRPRKARDRCTGCDHPMVVRDPGEGERRHMGRGLCSQCYGRAKRRGSLVTGAAVANEVQRLHVVGLSFEQIAAEVGITPAKARRLAA